MKKYLPVFLFIVIFAPTVVHADAWWGKGYRPPEWVLAHGGTIIPYTISGEKSKNVKAVMYRDGKYVEVEFGKSGTFDDAKDGYYDIIFYKCGKGCADQEFDNKKKIRGSDKAFAQVRVLATPGRTIRLHANADTKTVSVTGAAPPPKTKEQLLAEAAKRDQGKVYTGAATEQQLFAQLLMPQAQSADQLHTDMAIAAGVVPVDGFAHQE